MTPSFHVKHVMSRLKKQTRASFVSLPPLSPSFFVWNQCIKGRYNKPDGRWTCICHVIMTYLMILQVKTFEMDFICRCFSLYDHLCTLYPHLLTHHHSFHILLYFHLVTANQIVSLSSAVQTKRCTDVRSQICTMTPFQGATVVTLKTITPLSGLRGAITESDAQAEFVQRRD